MSHAYKKAQGIISQIFMIKAKFCFPICFDIFFFLRNEILQTLVKTLSYPYSISLLSLTWGNSYLKVAVSVQYSSYSPAHTLTTWILIIIYIYINICGYAKLLQSCPIFCDPMDCSPPSSSVHGILLARILEWVAIHSSWGSSQPRDLTQVSYVSYIGRWVLYY